MQVARFEPALLCVPLRDLRVLCCKTSTKTPKSAKEPQRFAKLIGPLPLLGKYLLLSQPGLWFEVSRGAAELERKARLIAHLLAVRFTG
jgi:hypothetical protein